MNPITALFVVKSQSRNAKRPTHLIEIANQEIIAVAQEVSASELHLDFLADESRYRR
jgi:hypothetical protein